MKRLSIITILLAVLCIPVKANESATYVGWVRSMWKCSTGAHVFLVFEPDDNSASLTMEFERAFCGDLPDRFRFLSLAGVHEAGLQ